MKFKEKDPLVSMEQWFPNDINCKVEGVRQANAMAEIKTTLWVHYIDPTNGHIKEELGNTEHGNCVSKKELSDTAVRLLVHTVNGKKSIVTKKGENYYGNESYCLAILSPSDWVLTYQSGRREVLTDKEKQERFE